MMRINGLNQIVLCALLIMPLLSIAKPATLSSLAAPQADETDVMFCEYIGEKLHLYHNDDQVYAMLEKKAREKATKRLYATYLKAFKSTVFSEDQMISKLASTIQVETTKRLSNGLFSPCIILKKPSLPEIATERFTKIKVARICTIKMNQLAGLTDSLKHRFAKRLKKRENDKDAVIGYMINDPKKIQRISLTHLYPLIHKNSDVKASLESVNDITCDELFVYPIELFVASS